MDEKRCQEQEPVLKNWFDLSIEELEDLNMVAACMYGKGPKPIDPIGGGGGD